MNAAARFYLLLPVSLLASLATGPAAAQPQDDAERIASLNRAFLAHLDQLGPQHAVAAATIRQAWQTSYRDAAPAGFVPDALTLLHPDYRAGLEAFDAGRPADAETRLALLTGDNDPYLAANARYFHARALWELGRFEELAASLADLEARSDFFALHTPYAPHLWLLRAAAQARTLRYDQAAATLAALHHRLRGVSEPVQVAARQLQLEIDRREEGTLGEVRDLMTYAAERLRVGDPGERTRARQQQAVALLDRLIEQMQQQEQQQSSAGRSARGSAAPRQPLGQPAQQSIAPEGPAQIGDLHASPRVEPGETWGNLPPAEREKILQAIRERFPSRYRELVEQYYRAMAQEK